MAFPLTKGWRLGFRRSRVDQNGSRCNISFLIRPTATYEKAKCSVNKSLINPFHGLQTEMDQETPIYPILWDSVKEVVRKYYLDEGRSLSEVVGLVNEYCHVEVTISQLTRQLRLWRFQKRIKRPELLYMAKICQMRASVHQSTAFLVRRRYYRDYEIYRKFKERGMTQNDILTFDESEHDLSDVKYSSGVDIWSQFANQDCSTPHHLMPQYNSYRAAGFDLKISHADPHNPALQTVTVRRHVSPYSSTARHLNHPNGLLRSSSSSVVIAPGKTGRSFQPSGSLYARRWRKKAIEITATPQIEPAFSNTGTCCPIDVHEHEVEGSTIKSDTESDIKSRMRVENILCHNEAD
jgi:hypothetical protein